MSVTASITGNITLTDSVTGTVPLSKALANLSFTGISSEFSQSFMVGTSPTDIDIPTTYTQFVYLKNVAPSNTVTVTWTPSGGSSAAVATLQAGSAIILCGSNTSTASGITDLSITASANNTPIEFVMAG